MPVCTLSHLKVKIRPDSVRVIFDRKFEMFSHHRSDHLCVFRHECSRESHSQSRHLHWSQSLLCPWGIWAAYRLTCWHQNTAIKYKMETHRREFPVKVMTEAISSGLTVYVVMCCRATRAWWMEEKTFVSLHGRVCLWCFSWWVIYSWIKTRIYCTMEKTIKNAFFNIYCRLISMLRINI